MAVGVLSSKKWPYSCRLIVRSRCSYSFIYWLSQSVVIPLSNLPSPTTLFFKLFLLILLILLLSKLGKDEEPGLLRLINPVKREGKPDLTDIELWPRCVPEGMIFKVTLILILSKSRLKRNAFRGTQKWLLRTTILTLYSSNMLQETTLKCCFVLIWTIWLIFWLRVLLLCSVFSARLFFSDVALRNVAVSVWEICYNTWNERELYFVWYWCASFSVRFL